MTTAVSSTPPAPAPRMWDRLDQLGRDRDLEGLAALFSAGELPPRDLRGYGEHDLVVSLVQPLLDQAVRRILSRLPRPLPWLGKSFDPDQQRGVNDFHPVLGPLLRLLSPITGWQRGPHGPQAFGFDTYVEAGAIDPAPRVLVIDYPFPGRPIRDEMVQVAPGVFLGRALLRRANDSYTNVAYWRLRTNTAAAHT